MSADGETTDAGSRGAKKVPEEPGTAWGTITGLPLPEGLHRLLASLEPGRGGVGPMPRNLSLAQLYVAVGEPLVRAWLGFAPPTLSSLRRDGAEEFFVLDAHSPVLPERQNLDSDGEASFSVLYLPTTVDWHTASAQVLHRIGGTSMRLTFGSGVPWPPSEPRTVRGVTSGHATMVDVHGTRVGVQHRKQGRTRLAWVLRRGGVVANVEVMIAKEPVAAVTTLLDSQVFAADPGESAHRLP